VDSIATDFNVLSLGFVDPSLLTAGGGAATNVTDLLRVTTWAQSKGMSVVWSIGGIAMKTKWAAALANGGAKKMAAEMGALANKYNIGWELDCEDDASREVDFNTIISSYRSVVPAGDAVKTLTLNVAGSSYRPDPTSGYLCWIGNVAKNPANLHALDRIVIMVGNNVTSDSAWHAFWNPSIVAYGAARTVLSRKLDTPRCGVADVGTTAQYIKGQGLAGMFTWGLSACNVSCTDCLGQEAWTNAQAAGQCAGLEAASKLVMGQ
jgi:hypothetical protein